MTFPMRWTTTLLGLLIAPLFYGQQVFGPMALHQLAANHASQPCSNLGCQGLTGTGQKSNNLRSDPTLVRRHAWHAQCDCVA